MGLRRGLHYGVTMADEGICPISPFNLKLPPPPSSRRFQTNQKTLSPLIMFIRLTLATAKHNLHARHVPTDLARANYGTSVVAECNA